MYSLDTSLFMDWQARYYPVNVFKALHSRIDGMIAAGQCRAVELVHEELDSVGTPELRAWAKGAKGLFVPLTSEIQMEGASIEASYPDLMDPKGLHESADAYVIALAKIEGGTVVSQETSAMEKSGKKKRYYIPDVCRDLGVPCINLLGMIRHEGWTF